MLSCQLRSPDRTFYEGEAESVMARSPRGEFGVLAHHAPLLAELAPGLLRIRTTDGDLGFACFGGTLSVDSNRVVILGSEIVPREEIDLEGARRVAADASLPPAEHARAQARLEVFEKVARRHE
jgi:F-type H+-transporting ATPase subunit epsilon